MKKLIIATLALATSPLSAQAPGVAENLAKTAEEAVELTPEQAMQQEIDQLRSDLERERQIATNARQQMDAMRKDMALKVELVQLGMERNEELYELAREVIDKGFSKSSAEPFLQMHRVKMEGLKQDYEDRAYAARIYPETLPPSQQAQQEQSANSAQ